MLAQSVEISRLVLVRLNPGDDILESVTLAAKENGVVNGLILGGIGSLSRYHVHVVKTTNLPPGDTFFEGEGPFDILQITGVILDGRVHAHITFSDTEKAMGGHLEKGCQVLTFSVITIAETSQADFTHWDRVGPL